jgi:hypothetical protein
MTSKYIDMAERAGWTGVQATLGVAITELATIPLWWAAPIALVLSAAKTWAIKKAA